MMTTQLQANDKVTVYWGYNDPCGNEATIQKITEKALQINGQWFPKSAFEKDSSVFLLTVKQWFMAKTTNQQQKALGVLR